MVEEQYIFLKRVCQLLVHLGISQLAPLWVSLSYECWFQLGLACTSMQQNMANFQRPETFELYMSVVLEFTNHGSQVSPHTLICACVNSTHASLEVPHLCISVE